MDKVLFSSVRDNWCTPKSLFDLLNNEFHFWYDLCADDRNHLCDNYSTFNNDMLRIKLVKDKGWYYCNPPYGRSLYKFVEHVYNSGAPCVMLLPSRTDTKWFHDFCLNVSEIRFIKGRLHFDDHKNAAPFPSMIVVFGSYKSRE